MQKIILAVYSSLSKHFGKGYSIDQDIPSELLIRVLIRRLIWFGRGLLIYRKPIFVEKRVRVLRKRNVRLGKHITLERGVLIDGFCKEGVHIGERSKVGAHSIVSCTSHLSKLGKGFRMGSDCGVSEWCYFGSSGGIEIGNDVIMGQFVSFHSEEHRYENQKLLIRKQGVVSKGIKVGNNVWIGAKVTLLDGAEIGSNSVIAAGSVVKGQFPNGSVIGGVPARVLQSLGVE